jgi:hypothetical protein
LSFDGVGPKVIPDLEQTFLADSGYTSPAVGDPVYVSGNNKVSLCAGANAAFIGFVQSVPPVDAFGNQLLNVYVFGHRIRCKNTSGSTLSAGAVITSANGGIAAWSPTTDTAVGGTLTANTTTGAITASATPYHIVAE